MEDYNQNQFQQPYRGSQNDEPVTVAEWIIMYLLMCIPCAGIIMLFVWAFGKNTKKSKANYCRAMLIIMAVMFALALVFWGIAVASIIGTGIMR